MAFDSEDLVGRDDSVVIQIVFFEFLHLFVRPLVSEVRHHDLPGRIHLFEKPVWKSLGLQAFLHGRPFIGSSRRPDRRRGGSRRSRGARWDGTAGWTCRGWSRRRCRAARGRRARHGRLRTCTGRGSGTAAWGLRSAGDWRGRRGCGGDCAALSTAGDLQQFVNGDWIIEA